MQAFHRLAISASVVAAIAILSKLTGFLREVALAFYFGAGVVTDAYLVATSIPGFFYFCVGAALTTAFIPAYARSSATEIERTRFLGSFLPMVVLVCLLLVVFIVWKAGLLVDVIAPGLSAEAKNLSRKFTQIFALGIFLTAAINVFTSILHVNGLFAVPAFSGLAFSLSVLLSIFIAYYFGPIYLICGPLLGKAIEVILMYPFVRRYFSGVVPKLDFSNQNTRSVFLLVGPMTLGLAAAQANLVIDRIFGSEVGSGAISSLSYAFALTNVVVSVVSVSVATVIYPSLAKMSAEEMHGSAVSMAAKALGIVLVVVAPSAVLLALFRAEIVSLVFGRGQFDAVAVSSTSVALGFYAFGIIGLTAREILTRIYYAHGRSLFPAINVIVASALNALLTFWLAPRYGIAGIALGTVLSVWVSTMWLVADSLQVLDVADRTTLIHSSAVVFGGVGVAAGASVVLREFSGLGIFLQLGCFAMTYGLLLLLAREPFSRAALKLGSQAFSKLLCSIGKSREF